MIFKCWKMMDYISSKMSALETNFLLLIILAFLISVDVFASPF